MRSALLAAALCLVLAVSAAAQHGGRPDGAGSSSTDTHGPGHEGMGGDGPMGAHDHLHQSMTHWDNASAGAREKGMARAEQHGLFARLTLDADGYVAGRFVTAHLASDTLHAYTVVDGQPIPFFSAITWSDPIASPRVTGSVLHLPGAGVSGMLHNNPTAQLQFHADNATTVTFHLATNATATLSSAQEARVLAGGIHGHVLAHNGTVTFDNATATVVVHLEAGGVAMFRAHPAKTDGALLHAENRAFTHGLMGATVRIADGGGEALEESDGGDVDATATSISNGTVQLTVGSEQHAGKLVTLVFDAGTLPASRLDALRIRLDGRDVPRAQPDALVDQNRTAAHVSAAGGQVFVALRFEHFSSYALSIEDPTQGPTTNGTPALPAFAALAVLALGAALLRRRA